MFDPRRAYINGLVSVTPNNGADVPRTLYGLNVSAAGVVRITTVGTDSEPSYTGLWYVTPGDNGMKCGISRVWVTDLTATIVAGIL